MCELCQSVCELFQSVCKLNYVIACEQCVDCS